MVAIHGYTGILLKISKISKIYREMTCLLVDSLKMVHDFCSRLESPPFPHHPSRHPSKTLSQWGTLKV